MFDVSSKTALITGSSEGLGFAFARGLAKAGACVIINGRNPEKLEQAAQTLSQEGLDVICACFDVTDKKGVDAAVADLLRRVEKIDILVNNAGTNLRAPLEEFTEDDWDTIMTVNLKGAYLVAQAVAKNMIQHASGKIINICSMQSELSRETIAPYAASKGGLKMLTKGMAVDWARYNIQINGLGPGYFKTELTRPLYEDPEYDAWLCSRTPSHRWGEPDELLGALIFLCSDASNYVNGQIIYVDGGLLASI
jgi:gluconate 5-dehydrogenase